MATVPTSAPRAGPGARPPLPVELTTFIGRESELRELERLLGSGRLLTLTGAGGSGKTRLALELAARSAAAGSPVVWVDLAPLGSPTLIPQHVAEALGVRDEVGGDDALVPLLRPYDGLLVLDNCEHLVDRCAALAHTLLHGCDSLRILATSREALGVRGERAWLVPPLSLPTEPHLGPGDAGTFEAVRLFVERARDVLPDFTLTSANAPAVVEICRRLDGIPLAIELAAARVRILPPEQISRRLDAIFQLLTDRGRTAVPRHRTLRAAIDWSHDLLQDSTKVLLRRQAVFRGGFTLDAAEDVCAGAGIDRTEVLDLVARLVDRSMLVVREHQGTARYLPLETVRQYALERLVESGEEDAIRRRHATYMLRLAEDAAKDAITPRRRRAYDALVQELDNLREALLWTREHDPQDHIRLVGKLGWFWFSIGHWTEARRWVVDALALPEAAESGLDRAQLLFCGGAMATLQADVDTARPWLEESAALAESVGALDVNAYALNYLGMTEIQLGRPEGKRHCSRAELFFRETGDDYGRRLALLLLGMAAQLEGDAEDAVRLTEEAVAVARRFGQDRELSVSLQNLAVLHLMQGVPAPAEPLLMEALAAARRDPSYFFIATTLDGMGEVRVHQGRIREAGRILGVAESVRQMIGARQFRVHALRLGPLLERVRSGPEGPVFEEARLEGLGLPMAAILDEILSATTAPPSPGAAPPVPEPAAPSAPAVPESPGPDLRIAALGELDISRGHQRLGADAWPYAKPKELLVFLAFHPGGRTREQIGQAIWPGSSPAQVKNSFHVTLHHLRKTLGGAHWIVIDGDRYLLAPGLRCDLDAERFEREAREALRRPAGGADRLRSILALYRGDLLDGEVTGPWVEEHRDRLRRLMVDLGLALGAALEADGDDRGAADVYHRIAAREELNEEAQRRLMLAWARAGERVRALRHYERLVALLRDELDCEPEPETVKIYETLRLAVSA